jgi:hypothetical protein
VCRTAALVALGLQVSAAHATTPSPPNSTVPCGVVLVGTTAGVADAFGQITIVVRDLANNPVPGSNVLIDFENCDVDIRLCGSQPHPGTTPACGGGPVGAVSAVTDGAGAVSLRIVGGARNDVNGWPGETGPCANVYADGVLIGDLQVATLDQDGHGGVNAADLSLWLDDFFSASGFLRSDYNCASGVAVVDLSLWLSAYFAGGSTTSCASFCH